jgi:hypothetical protein
MPPLLRCVTFQSERFETRNPAPHFINPGNFGEDMAAWLRGRLPASLEAGPPIQEDYGWGIWTRAGDDRYWIAIGLMDEADDEEARTWLMTVAWDPGLNILKRLFHRPSPDDLSTVCHTVDRALHGEPAIRDIRWWDAQPLLGAGAPHPPGRPAP